MGVHTKPATNAASSPGNQRGYVLRFVVAPIVLVLIGISIMLAPVVSTQWHNMEQQRVAREFSEQLAQLEQTELDREWDEAQWWNASKSSVALGDPWTTRADNADPHYLSYLEEINLTPVMARIHVPVAGINLPVYHGTEEHTLSHGAGHLYGTDLPVGGPGTHAVITGHTGISTATLFDNLIDVTHNDLMAVEVLGETLHYRVTSIETVLPHEVEALRPQADRDLLTLITCTPYGINTHRLLVTGERVDTPDVPLEQASTPIQPWMLLAMGLSLVLVLVTFLILAFRRKKDH